jgi:cytochrome c-type biogenesis protein CcmH
MNGQPQGQASRPASAANKRQVKRFAAIAGAGVVVIALAVAWFRPQHESLDARAHNLEQHIACPVCVGESVADSNSSASADIRADVQRRMKEGQSDSEILGYYARTYPKQMLNPSNDGLGLIAWGLPVVVVILALAGLGFAITRWKREPRLVATDEDEKLVERARRLPEPS